MPKSIARAGAVVTATSLFVLLGAGVASAHVTVFSPDNPTKGGDAQITFRVPNEEDTAHTTKVQVNFSATSPLSNAAIEPVPGWTAQENMVALANPVKMNGQTIKQAVGSIVWTAPAGGGTDPGQFQEFTIWVESLPDNTGALFLPTVQTYDNGHVVNWNEPTVTGQPDPQHPAPSLALAAATSTTAAAPAATSTSDSTARWLAGGGLLVGVLGLVFGLVAILRRRPVAGTSSDTGAKEESTV
jgi:uncharacterized protein YcnI